MAGKRNKKLRFLSAILTAALVLSVMPLSSFAAESKDEPGKKVETVQAGCLADSTIELSSVSEGGIISDDSLEQIQGGKTESPEQLARAEQGVPAETGISEEKTNQETPAEVTGKEQQPVLAPAVTLYKNGEIYVEIIFSMEDEGGATVAFYNKNGEAISSSTVKAEVDDVTGQTKFAGWDGVAAAMWVAIDKIYNPLAMYKVKSGR